MPKKQITRIEPALYGNNHAGTFIHEKEKGSIKETAHRTIEQQQKIINNLSDRISNINDKITNIDNEQHWSNISEDFMDTLQAQVFDHDYIDQQKQMSYTALRYMGNFENHHRYHTGDVVYYLGLTYLCIHKGRVPLSYKTDYDGWKIPVYLDDYADTKNIKCQWVILVTNGKNSIHMLK